MNERTPMTIDHGPAADGSTPPTPAVYADDLSDETLARLIDAVMLLAEDFHMSATPWWEPLTGLQILLLRTIARTGGVTRTDLGRDCRTSRAAVSPGLASLIRQGYVTEAAADGDSVLTLGTAGRDMLDRIGRARVDLVRRALHERPRLGADSARHLIACIEHLRRSEDLASGDRGPGPDPGPGPSEGAVR
ncbi:hypothetical protein C5C13_06865 [Clavibacter michiganensis]|nr:hypothetical protein C5C13_06865 [Clavibacter michiganensis]